jgi:hypothetical protein
MIALLTGGDATYRPLMEMRIRLWFFRKRAGREM